MRLKFLFTPSPRNAFNYGAARPQAFHAVNGAVVRLASQHQQGHHGSNHQHRTTPFWLPSSSFLFGDASPPSPPSATATASAEAEAAGQEGPFSSLSPRRVSPDWSAVFRPAPAADAALLFAAPHAAAAGGRRRKPPAVFGGAGAGAGGGWPDGDLTPVSSGPGRAERGVISAPAKLARVGAAAPSYYARKKPVPAGYGAGDGARR